MIEYLRNSIHPKKDGAKRHLYTGIINYLYVDVGEYADIGKPIVDIVNID